MRALRSIQIQLPLLLFIVGILSITSLYIYLLRHESDSHKAEVSRSLNAAGTRLAGMADYLLQQEDKDALRMEVYLLGQFPDLVLAVVADGHDKILNATQQSWHHRPLADSPLGIANSLIQQARATMSGRWGEFNNSGLMVGAYAFQMPIKQSGLSPEGVGIAVMGIDLTNSLLAAKQEARRIALIAGAALSLVTLLLWYVLHRLLNRPVQELVRTTRAFSVGNYDASANIASGNEMGELSSTLDTLGGVSREREQAQAGVLRLAQIVENSVNEIYVADGDSYQIIDINRIARENLGYSDEEAQSLYPWDFVQDMTRDNIEKMITPLRDGNIEVETFKTDHVRKNGSTYPVLTRLQYLSHLTPPVYCAIVQDITKSQQQQAALELRDRAIEEVDAGVLITDALQDDNPIVYVNPAIEKMSGYSAEELIGRNPRLLRGEDHDQPEVERIRKALIAQEPVQVLLRNYRKDSSQFMDEVSISPVRDADGTVTHFIGIQRDVTERLAKDARLLQSEKIDAIGQLSGGVAHDFNNLLTVISGYLELLREDLDDPELRGFADEAHSAAQMGTRLTRRLLAFARKGTLEPTVLNINDQILSAMELIQTTIGKTITLSSNLSQKLWTTRADPSEVENTVINLAINARDAMPDGGQIQFETTNIQLDGSDQADFPDLPEGDYIRLTVSDNGSGMPDKVKARIFEPFYTTKPEGKGTGLGLASIYGFAKQSGGVIDVKSEVGVGTTFSVYLPRCEKAADSPSGSVRHSGAIDNKSKRRVLVVEDNELVRRLAINLLNKLGFDPLSAIDGASAVRILETEKGIDVVLSDVVMEGGMSGYDVAQWVQNNRPNCSVVLTSGFADELVKDTEINPERIHFLSKPYSQEELSEVIANAL